MKDQAPYVSRGPTTITSRFSGESTKLTVSFPGYRLKKLIQKYAKGAKSRFDLRETSVFTEGLFRRLSRLAEVVFTVSRHFRSKAVTFFGKVIAG